MSVTETQAVSKLTLPSLEVNAKVKHGDWRDEFFRQGYYIFKNVISAEKATSYYQAKALEWLQSFDNGFNLNDRSTWTKEHLPQNFRNMFLNYCAPHEKFMWDARTEPSIIKIFEELWATKELLVSFDSLNITLPGRSDADFTPWPHVDQAPERSGLSCVQGLLNLSQAGPEDGGLLLMVGSSALFEEFFSLNAARGRTNVNTRQYDLYVFEDDEVEWFRRRGCHQIKVNLEPGDFVVWDSRTIHQVALPDSDTIRTVIYTCYTPAALATPEHLAYKAELFNRFEGTTHWPHCNIWGQGKAYIDGKIDPKERSEPLERPLRTEQILKLAGLKPYC